MKVKLISKTENPIETMMYAFDNMHNPIADSLEEYVSNQKRKFGEAKWLEIKKSFLKMLSHHPHNTVLEFVNTVWYISGTSRAFQQQLTRTRLAAYSIQSLRIVDVGKFADSKEYHTPDRLKSILTNQEEEGAKIYEKAMKDIQKAYNKLLDIGCKTEDARGILPLNIFSPITMSINLRSLSHMAEARLCNLAQGEFREVVKEMINELKKELGEEFSVLFQKPCERAGKCVMPINCGKTEFSLEEKEYDMDVSIWLKG